MLQHLCSTDHRLCNTWAPNSCSLCTEWITSANCQHYCPNPKQPEHLLQPQCPIFQEKNLKDLKSVISTPLILEWDSQHWYISDAYYQYLPLVTFSAFHFIKPNKTQSDYKHLSIHFCIWTHLSGMSTEVSQQQYIIPQPLICQQILPSPLQGQERARNPMFPAQPVGLAACLHLLSILCCVKPPTGGKGFLWHMAGSHYAFGLVTLTRCALVLKGYFNIPTLKAAFKIRAGIRRLKDLLL